MQGKCLRIVLGLALAIAGWAYAPAARAVTGAVPASPNELSGGLGLSIGITGYTPGGFKWFNEYARRINDPFWLFFQFNVAVGSDNEKCWHRHDEDPDCDFDQMGGSDVQFAVGAELKWPAHAIPLEGFAKFGGTLDLLIEEMDDFAGLGIGFRFGGGIRYFIFPSFGIGAELMTTLGPVLVEIDEGIDFMAGIDFHLLALEWRF